MKSMRVPDALVYRLRMKDGDQSDALAMTLPIHLELLDRLDLASWIAGKLTSTVAIARRDVVMRRFQHPQLVEIEAEASGIACLIPHQVLHAIFQDTKLRAAIGMIGPALPGFSWIPRYTFYNDHAELKGRRST